MVTLILETLLTLMRYNKVTTKEVQINHLRSGGQTAESTMILWNYPPMILPRIGSKKNY